MIKKRINSTETFIERAATVHEHLYDYPRTIWTSSTDKVIVTCLIHGDFNILSSQHIRGSGCNRCGWSRTGQKHVDDKEKFIEKSRKKHGDKYNYDKSMYVSSRSLITITCQHHGDFDQIAGTHSKGHGYMQCGIITSAEKTSSNNKDFAEKSNKLHGNSYGYELVEYTKADAKVKIVCKSHGLFMQTPHIHLSGHGCPKCNTSKGEKLVEDWLIEHEISHVREYRFQGCKNTNTLPYDFYLPNENILIEYDGEQHFRAIDYWGGEERFKKQQESDEIKTKYAIDNNIPLLRIKYDLTKDEARNALTTFIMEH